MNSEPNSKGRKIDLAVFTLMWLMIELRKKTSVSWKMETISQQQTSGYAIKSISSIFCSGKWCVPVKNFVFIFLMVTPDLLILLSNCQKGHMCTVQPLSTTETPSRGHETAPHSLLLTISTGFYGPKSAASSPDWSVLKIHFFIESGLKMIQFKIQFKTKSGTFIQKS